MEKINTNAEVYKVVKYQTKLADMQGGTREKQIVYKQKLNEHVNNLLKSGLNPQQIKLLIQQQGGESTIDALNELQTPIMEKLEKLGKSNMGETNESLKKIETSANTADEIMKKVVEDYTKFLTQSLKNHKDINTKLQGVSCGTIDDALLKNIQTPLENINNTNNELNKAVTQLMEEAERKADEEEETKRKADEEEETKRKAKEEEEAERKADTNKIGGRRVKKH